MEVQVSQMRVIVVPYPCCALPRSGASTSQSPWAAFSPWKLLLSLPVTLFSQDCTGSPPLPGLSQRHHLKKLKTPSKDSTPASPKLASDTKHCVVCVLKICEDGALWAFGGLSVMCNLWKVRKHPSALHPWGNTNCGNVFSTISRTLKCYIYVVCCQ